MGHFVSPTHHHMHGLWTQKIAAWQQPVFRLLSFPGSTKHAGKWPNLCQQQQQHVQWQPGHHGSCRQPAAAVQSSTLHACRHAAVTGECTVIASCYHLHLMTAH